LCRKEVRDQLKDSEEEMTGEEEKKYITETEEEIVTRVYLPETDTSESEDTNDSDSSDDF